MPDISEFGSVQNLQALFTEAFEIAFLLCNHSLKYFGVHEVLEVVQQIMPTAFIYHTCYWVFFSGLFGTSLCVCQRYGIPCRHSFFKGHWINVSMTKNVNSFNIRRNLGIFGIPINFSVEIIPLDHFKSIDVVISFMIQACNSHINGSVYEEHSKPYIIRARYSIMPECMSAKDQLIKFMPHPASHHFYGSIFPHLLQKYTFVSPYGNALRIPSSHLVDIKKLPQFTLTLSNLFISEEETSMTMFTFTNQANIFHDTKKKRDSATQTDELDLLFSNMHLKESNNNSLICRPIEQLLSDDHEMNNHRSSARSNAIQSYWNEIRKKSNGLREVDDKTYAAVVKKVNSN